MSELVPFNQQFELNCVRWDENKWEQDIHLTITTLNNVEEAKAFFLL